LIPYETLAAEMSSDYKTKAKFAGARILCGQISAILAGILPGWIIQALGKDSADTFLYLGIIFAAIFMFVGSMLYLFSWERTREEVERFAPPVPHKSAFAALVTLYSDLLSTFRIRAFRLHLGMYLGGYISQDVFNAVFTYFIVFALGSTVVVASGLMGTMAFAQLIAVAVFIQLVMRFHPAPSYRVAVTLFAVGVLGFFMLYRLQPNNLAVLLYVPVVIAGLGRGGLNYIPWNVYNYMADVDEIVTGRRREGAFAGVMTFVRKTMQAIAVMAVGVLLQAGGFVSGSTTQTSQAVSTIVTIMTVATLCVLIFGVIVSLRFKLTRESHAVLMNEIEHLKAGGTAPTSTEARQVVEDLSGFEYARLWGRR
jgi:oligogalacturonide transporter